MQIMIHCKQPSLLASRAFEQDHVVEAQLLPEESAVLIKTRDPDGFHRMLNRLVVKGMEIEGVTPADDDVNSVYQYLIGGEEVTS